MKLISPSAALWQQPSDYKDGIYRHVAQCARVCRQVTNPKSDDLALCAGLMKRQHLSMFRHCTYYFCVPGTSSIPPHILTNIINRKFVFHTCIRGALPPDPLHGGGANTTEGAKPSPRKQKKHISPLPRKGQGGRASFRHYLAINGNAWLDLPEKMQQYLLPFRLTEQEFMLGGKANTHPDLSKTLPLLRTTVSIITQISTSRELNRVSPNNITEQSTRYVNFGRKGGITICRPHWYDRAPWYKKAFALLGWQLAEWQYLLALRLGMKPEDARGFLPLDTATQCIYTYTNKEWQHLFDLRIQGTTGKPHPNAIQAATLIREQVDIHNKVYQLTENS